MSKFSLDQEEQIIAWLTEGMPVREVRRRIEISNIAQDQLAPWPLLTEHDIQVFRDRTKEQVSLAITRRASTTLMEGLAKRDQLAVYLEDKIWRLDQTVNLLGDALAKLIARGAFDIDEHDLSPREPDELIEGDVVARDGESVPPKRMPAHASKNVSEAEAMGLDPRRIFLRELLLDRAVTAGKTQAMLLQQLVRMAEILGRVTATIDQDKPIDNDRYRKAMEAAEKVMQRSESYASEASEDDDDET